MQATTNPLSQTLSDCSRYTPLFNAPMFGDAKEPFWETVREVADHYAQNLPVRPRFISAIVLGQIKVAGQIPARQIIDGQQRLTTSHILLSAVREFYLNRSAEKD